MSVARAILISAAFLAASVGACSSFTTDSPSNGASDAGPVTTMVPDASPGSSVDAGLEAFTELSTGWTSLRGVVADETSVYFTEQGTGLLHVVPLAGGATATPEGQTAGAPLQIARVAKTTVWVDEGDRSFRSWSAGDPPKKSPSLVPAPFALAPSSMSFAFMLSRDSEVAEGALQSRSPDQLDRPISNFDGLAGPSDLAAVGPEVYVALAGSGSIAHFSAMTTGVLEAREPVSTAERGCQLIAGSELGVAWTLGTGDVRAALAGATGLRPPTLLATDAEILALAADPSGFYWVRSDGTVRRSSSASAVPETVASGFQALRASGARSLALTKDYVVVLTSDGRVLRHAK